MPSSNIHLKVAYELNKRLNINSPDFIVGNIAPDAVNVNGFAPKEERWPAHLRNKDLDIWISNAKEFYFLNKDKYNYEFLLGYISHILTDILHDKYLYMKQRTQIIKDTKCEDNEAHDILRNDMDNYSFSDFDAIKEVLSNYQNTFEILNVKKEQLDRWIKIVLEKYRENGHSIYQTEDDIESLINMVIEELKELMYKEDIKYK